MNKLNNQKFFGLSSIFFAIFGLLGFALLFFSGSSWKILYDNSLAIDRAIYTAQLHLTKGHLWFEEKLHGDEEVTLSQVWLHFENAQSSINQLQIILKHFNPYFFLNTAKTQIPINALLKVKKQITQLEKEANERWNTRSNTLVEAKYDIQFDALFEEILTEVMFVKHALDEILDHAMAKQLRLQILILSFWIVLLLIAFLSANYLEQKRRQQESKANILANFPVSASLFL